jgi:hypothetical protein
MTLKLPGALRTDPSDEPACGRNMIFGRAAEHRHKKVVVASEHRRGIHLNDDTRPETTRMVPRAHRQVVDIAQIKTTAFATVLIRGMSISTPMMRGLIMTGFKFSGLTAIAAICLMATPPQTEAQVSAEFAGAGCLKNPDFKEAPIRLELIA